MINTAVEKKTSQDKTEISIDPRNLLQLAKGNPEFAALIFTIISTVSYFTVRIIAFLFYFGKCLYNGVDSRYIHVNSDSVLFITIFILITAIIAGLAVNGLQKFFLNHRAVAGVAFFTFGFVFWITLSCEVAADQPLFARVIASVVLSVLVLLIMKLEGFLKAFMYKNINLKIDQELMKLRRQTRIGIGIGGLVILTMAVSFFMGYSSAKETRMFRTVDEEYAVLYMNDEIAVCSPFTEKDGCIMIDREAQKNYDLSDIEFRTRIFDDVRWKTVKGTNDD